MGKGYFLVGGVTVEGRKAGSARVLARHATIMRIRTCERRPVRFSMIVYKKLCGAFSS